MISIAYHPCYELELPRGHRFPMEKYPMLKEQLIYEGTFSRENFFTPKKLDRKIIENVHDRNYVQKLLDLTLNNSEIRKIGFPLNIKFKKINIINNGKKNIINIADITLSKISFIIKYVCIDQLNIEYSV